MKVQENVLLFIALKSHSDHILFVFLHLLFNNYDYSIFSQNLKKNCVDLQLQTITAHIFGSASVSEKLKKTRALLFARKKPPNILAQ